MEFNHIGYCLYHLSVHVFLTTELPLLLQDTEWRASLIESLRAVAESQQCELGELSAKEDYVHFVLRFPPTATLSEVVAALKSESSASLQAKFSTRFHEKRVAVWSSGFLVCSVGGAPLEMLERHFTDLAS